MLELYRANLVLRKWGLTPAEISLMTEAEISNYTTIIAKFMGIEPETGKRYTAKGRRVK